MKTGAKIGHLTDSTISMHPYNGCMTSTSSLHQDHRASDGSLSLAVAARLIDAIAARDFDAIADTFADDVAFRALLPKRILDVHGSDAVRDVFVRWFDSADRWELNEAIVGEVGGRIHLRWRVRLTDDRIGVGTFLVEQQVYADGGTDGRLYDVALLCTGYRPEAP